MRTIVKGAEPLSLSQHRKSAHASYDNYQDKDQLRETLVKEQRHICCYCMDHIAATREHMKIEHWRSQSRYPSKQLEYSNLLGACMGGEGQPSRLQHCDTRKGNLKLKWNPADRDRSIETRIQYTSDGSVRSDDKTFCAQIDDVLNLNLPLLKNNRNRVSDEFHRWLKEEKRKVRYLAPRRRLRRRIKRKLKALRSGTRPLTPFCQVAIRLLERQLQR